MRQPCANFGRWLSRATLARNTCWASCTPRARGVPEDDAEAVRWCRKAAEQGLAAAQYMLGFMYAEGEGVPEDDAEAAKWFRKAAEQGDVEAQSRLGFMYVEGEGVPEDDAEAVRWYRKAAEQGLAHAQFMLGFMYAEGEGVPEDLVQAHAWFNIAAAQGLEEAEKIKRSISERMTHEQHARAQELAHEYWQKHVLPFRTNAR